MAMSITQAEPGTIVDIVASFKRKIDDSGSEVWVFDSFMNPAKRGVIVKVDHPCGLVNDGTSVEWVHVQLAPGDAPDKWVCCKLGQLNRVRAANTRELYELKRDRANREATEAARMQDPAVGKEAKPVVLDNTKLEKGKALSPSEAKKF